MAMHKSEDLSNVASVMFEQMKNLGGDLFAFGIVLCDKYEKMVEQWHSLGNEGMMPSFFVPIDLDYIHQYRYDQWNEGTELFSIEIPEDYIARHFELMFELPSVAAAMNEVTAKNIKVEVPKWEIDYGASFKHGYLLVSSLKPFKEDHIFPRFAKVFEQAYIRFLDLQKAEVQAREAQIETALERVRSRSMGMQKSEELKEVIQVVYEQFVQLNISIEHTGFIMDYKARDDMYIWLADRREVPFQVTIPYFDSPHWNSFNEAKASGKDFFANHLSFEEKNKFYQDLFKYIPGVPEETKKYYFNCPGLAISTVLLDNVGLYIENFSGTPYSDEENKLLMRFGKVFQQTYTRFLDLQKAEAQAREAQIEAGLERVRSRSMAMHKSDELLQAGELLYKELSKLGIANLVCGYVLIDKENKVGWNYGVNPGTGTIKPLPTGNPLAGTKVFESITASWEKQEPLLVIELDPQETIKHQTYIAENVINFPITKEQLLSISPEKLKIHTFNFSQGYLLIVGDLLLNVEQQEMVVRFAKVFEQTYTRFLDLKKAEAQAREAKIETALEKVRARTMGMQHSDELPEAANLLFLEVQALGIPAWSAGYNVLAEDKKSSDCWMSSEGAIQEPAILYFTEETSFIEWYDFLQSEETFFVQELGGEALVDHYNYLRSIPDIGEVLKKLDDAGIELPTYQINHLCKFTHGFLLFITYEPVPESHDIFRRFAKVFEQTYTRFLDLQKAEAQAREAQIEAALERVRSRSMGMQKSEELKEVIRVVYEQFIHLKINVDHAGFIVDYTPKGDWHFWIADEQDIPSKITHPYFESVWANQFNEAKEKGEDFFATNLNFEEKNKFYNELLAYVPGLPEASRDFYLNCPGLAGSTVLLDNVGLYIENFSGTPYSDEENKILMRFGKVFQQTYTRFLDLQKAEAQAKEAQIEAALERVRARAMGMHKSEEVGEVSDLLFSELNKLNLDVLGCSVVVIDEDKDKMELWRARSNVAIKPFESTSFSEAMNLLKKNMPDWFPTFIKALEKRINYLVDELLDERRSQFINAIAEQYKYSDAEKSQLLNNAPEKITTHYIFFKLGYLALLGEKKLSDENLSITRRFVEVFEFSYTRFLDIKKAEEQAREAQIEAALEKVRSRSIGMQKSEELREVIQVIHDQLINLNFEIDAAGFTLDYHQNNDWNTWIANKSGSLPSLMFIPYIDHPQFNYYKYAKEKELDFLANTLSFEEKNSIFNYMFEFMGDYPQTEKDELLSKPGLAISQVFLKNISLWIYNLDAIPYSEEDNSTLMRFAKVFEQTYVRFNDLKQAEAQAREVQIELSLERIRAQATAMRESSDLLDIVVTMRTEFVSLGHEAHYFWHMRWLPDKYEKAMTSGDGTRIGMVMELPRGFHGNSVMTEWEKNDEPVVIIRFDVDGAIDYVDKMIKTGQFHEIDPNAPGPDDIRAIGGLTFIMARTTHGEIGYSLPGVVERLPDEDLSTLVRFAGVFDLAHRRFEDLKRAEHQFRESRIELGLERVRAKAMAMHTSNDLALTVDLFFSEINRLEVTPHRSGVGIIDSKTRIVNIHAATSTSENKIEAVTGNLKLSGHPILSSIFDHWKMQKEYHPVLHGNEIAEYYNIMNPQITFPDFADDETQYGYYFFFKEGGVFAWTDKELSERDLNIFRRFNSVLSLTYRRYMDLKDAEKRTRAAEQQASLDRVRGEIASMRTTEDLEKITPLIWRELTNLNIKFFRCGVFIIDETSQIVKVYLTTPAGKPLAALHLPFNSSTLVTKTIKHWNEHKVYKEQWSRKQFIAWSKSLVEQGFIKDTSQYQGGEKPPESLSLQFLPFAQGMLYVGSAAKLSEEEIETAQKLADSFGVAYARYEDFQKLEAANHRKSLELEEARQLQLAMLPKVLPQLPNLDIAVYMQTATEVGGDYYDFNVGENGELTAVIGDATGHGMKAGTIVTITKSLFNSLAHDDDILNTFSKISKVIKDMKFKQLSMCLMMLKIHKNKIIISSAAMPPALIFRKKKNIVEEIELKGMPLGAMENFPYQVRDASVDSGDTILLMSDGLPELPNGNSEMYGYDRIMNEFKLVGKKPPEKIIDHLKKSAAKWTNGNDPDDDITFVVIKVK